MDLRDVIPRTSKRKDYGRYSVDCCPFHEDSHPSFIIWTTRWECKAGCGKGTISDYLKRTGQSVPTIEYERPKPRAQPKEALPQSLGLDYHLRMGKEEREWYHWRGLTDETINKYELGYGPPPGSKVGRFSIPVYESGRLVNVRFRRDDRCPECASRATKEIDKEHFSCDYCEHQWQVHPSKYMGIAQHNDARLYNAECLKGARRVFICEGEIDALSLVQRGYSAVSSTSGAGTFLLSWTVHFLHAALLYLCYDSDEPGRKGAEAIREAIPKARIISMPEKDINKYFLSHSTEEFEQLVREADRNPENEMKLRVATLNGSLIGETY